MELQPNHAGNVDQPYPLPARPQEIRGGAGREPAGACPRSRQRRRLRQYRHHPRTARPQEEALKWFDRALALRPDFIEALNNKAFVLGRLHRFDEAFATYDRRVETLDPDNAPAGLGLGAAAHADRRFRGRLGRARGALSRSSASAAYPKFSQPMWLGEENIEGKTILIHVDEGLGDTIQFARYVPMVAARGARVILVVLDAAASAAVGTIRRLAVPADFGRRAAGIRHALPDRQPAAGVRNAARYHSVRDIVFAAARRGPRAGLGRPPRPPTDKLRVGLVWSGNPEHGNDHNRSIPLRMLSAASSTPMRRSSACRRIRGPTTRRCCANAPTSSI